LGVRQKKPKDKLIEEVAFLMLYPNESFERMTAGLFVTKVKDNFLAHLTEAQKKVVDAEEIEKKVSQAKKNNLIYGLKEEELVNDAKRIGIINEEEAKKLLEVAKLRDLIIAVDSFSKYIV
jgi:DNA primase large subunit